MPVLTKRDIQTKKIEAQAWSHLHIGSGTVLSRWEYFFITENGVDTLVLLDYNKLADMAQQQPTLVDNLTKAASDNSLSLHKFLAQHPDQTLAKRLSKPHSNRKLPPQLRAGNRTKISELRMMPGSPNVYIPGSSIKGALRTAYLVKEIQEGKIVLPQRPKQDESEYKKTLKKEINRQFTDLNSPENKFFQNILISDSKTLDEEKLGIARVGSPSDENNRQGGPRPQMRGSQSQQVEVFCEVLLSQFTFDFEVSARASLTDGNLKSPVKYLFETADQFYRDIWIEEKQLRTVGLRQDPRLLNFYSNEEMTPPTDCYLLRLGYGSGQLATSILKPYRDHYKKDFGDEADRPLRTGPIYRKKPDLLTRQPYPFSAKCALADDGLDQPEAQAMGWVLIPKTYLN